MPTWPELLDRARRLDAAGFVAEARTEASTILAATQDGPTRLDCLMLVANETSLTEVWNANDASRSPRAGLLVARAMARRDDSAGAIAQLDEILARYPKSHEAAEGQLLAAALTREIDRAEALPRYDAIAEAFVHRPEADEALWAKAWTLRTLERTEESEVALDALASRTEDPERRAQALYWRGKALESAAENGDGFYAALVTAKQNTNPTVSSKLDTSRIPLPSIPVAAPLALKRAAALLAIGLKTEAAEELEDVRSTSSLLPLLIVLYESADRFDRAMQLAQRDPTTLARHAYPLAYASTLIPAAQGAGVDPLFLLALMRNESAFRPEVRSNADARGLMQLLPTTAQKIAAARGETAPDALELAEPKTELPLAAWYVGQLLKRFHGDVAVAAAAYNAGPRVVATWVVGGEARDEWIENIPYRETRRYVKSVVAAYANYVRIYGGAAVKLEGRLLKADSGIDF